MNFSRIRGFLLQLPKPSRVMISSADEDPTELKVGGSYAKLAKTIEAKNVDLIECFDANGVMLRALRLTSPEAQRSDAAEIPRGIESDPHALMLTHFANLLHRAYEHSTEVAFARMVEVTAIMSERSESIEMRLERTEAQNRRLQQDQIESLYEQAEAEAERKAAEAENGGLVDKLAGAFFSGQSAGAPAANGAGKANGSARKGAS